MFMKTQREYIDILNKNAKKIREDFGIKSLCLFGSVARNEQNENSDVDICVTMEANPFLRIRLKEYLENILGSPVDVIREHNNMNHYLKQQIHKDAIYIFQ